MADLPIEEANRIRQSMGLAPLPVPGAAAAAPTGPAFKQATQGDSDSEPASTVETRQAAAYDNWKQLQVDQEAKKKKQDRLAAIKKERERAARFAQLEGKGLADEDDNEDDMTWLKTSKKRQKKIAKAEQTQRDLEERERQAREAMQYTEVDLAGVKVGHEMDQFDDGEDQILVLKDTGVDADDDDELEAVALKEQERLQEKLDSKKRKRVYDPNDDSAEKSILAQYDEEIDGKKRKAFTLDGQGRTVEERHAEAAGQAQAKRVAISLDLLAEAEPQNDYMDLSEIKMKKPKKKKSKSFRRKRTDDDDEDAAAGQAGGLEDDMDVDRVETLTSKPQKKSLLDESFVDDEDLQAQLAAQRRQALKKRTKWRPEDLARQLREETSPLPGTPGEVDSSHLTGGDGDELVIDETTEFVHNLASNVIEEITEPSVALSSSDARDPDTRGNLPSPDGDVDMSYAEAAEIDEQPDPSAGTTEITETGLEQEKTVDQGLGATLALLKQRGVIASADAGDKNAQFRERQKFLADKQRAEESAERLRKDQRERERNSARWNNMTPREREEWARKNNLSADQMESRKLADIFNKEYKPNVELNYVDEHGRHLNEKEAFKMLSHQFHGKGSGNTKTKKHLDKIANEKRRLADSALDTSRAGGLSNALDQQSKKHKFAGVRLQ